MTRLAVAVTFPVAERLDLLAEPGRLHEDRAVVTSCDVMSGIEAAGPFTVVRRAERVARVLGQSQVVLLADLLHRAAIERVAERVAHRDGTGAWSDGFA